jgi:hypothetical protein
LRSDQLLRIYPNQQVDAEMVTTAVAATVAQGVIGSARGDEYTAAAKINPILGCQMAYFLSFVFPK